MADSYQYPVYFECHSLLSEKDNKKTEMFFRVHRLSGGGDCGPLTRVADNFYSIAFKRQEGTETQDFLLLFVLRRCLKKQGRPETCPSTRTHAAMLSCTLCLLLLMLLISSSRFGNGKFL